MLAPPTTLPDGLRVRMRLPQALDRAGLRALHDRLGLHAEELDIVRALRFDPRTSVVVCATAWIDGTERLVGYGAIDKGAAEPRLVICDEVCAAGVTDLVLDALRARSGTRTAA